MFFIWVSVYSFLGFFKIWCLGFKNECFERKEVEIVGLRFGFGIYFWYILLVRVRG